MPFQHHHGLCTTRHRNDNGDLHCSRNATAQIATSKADQKTKMQSRTTEGRRGEQESHVNAPSLWSTIALVCATIHAAAIHAAAIHASAINSIQTIPSDENACNKIRPNPNATLTAVTFFAVTISFVLSTTRACASTRAGARARVGARACAGPCAQAGTATWASTATRASTAALSTIANDVATDTAAEGSTYLQIPSKWYVVSVSNIAMTFVIDNALTVIKEPTIINGNNNEVRSEWTEYKCMYECRMSDCINVFIKKRINILWILKNILRAAHDIPISFFFYTNYITVYFCTYLSGHFLEAPREYIHPGLVLGLDWASCQLSSTCVFLVCPGPPIILLFIPTIHVSHMYPPLTTRQLNTGTQVNNMGMLHLTYNRHAYLHHIIFTIQFFLHTSSTLLGRPAGPDPSCQEQYECKKLLTCIWLTRSAPPCDWWQSPKFGWNWLLSIRLSGMVHTFFGCFRN